MIHSFAKIEHPLPNTHAFMLKNLHYMKKFLTILKHFQVKELASVCQYPKFGFTQFAMLSLEAQPVYFNNQNNANEPTTYEIKIKEKRENEY